MPSPSCLCGLPVRAWWRLGEGAASVRGACGARSVAFPFPFPVGSAGNVFLCGEASVSGDASRQGGWRGLPESSRAAGEGRDRRWRGREPPARGRAQLRPPTESSGEGGTGAGLSRVFRRVFGLPALEGAAGVDDAAGVDCVPSGRLSAPAVWRCCGTAGAARRPEARRLSVFSACRGPGGSMNARGGGGADAVGRRDAGAC